MTSSPLNQQRQSVIATVNTNVFLINDGKHMKSNILWFQFQKSSIILASVFLILSTLRNLILLPKILCIETNVCHYSFFAFFYYVTEYFNIQHNLSPSNENSENRKLFF